MRDVRLQRYLETRASEWEVINCPRRYFYLARDPFVDGVTDPAERIVFLFPAAKSENV